VRIGAFVLSLAISAAAVAVPPPPFEEHELQSRVLAAKRALLVATPEGYKESGRSYPVLVVLDANDSPELSLILATANYLADNTPTIPPMIAVGIVNGPDRLHDMLPPATGKDAARFPTSGGAGDFARFLIDEVLPWVRARYRTLPTTLLAGHSAGGLFGIDVAASRPGAFQGIVAMSPAIWMNDFALVPKYASAIKSAKAPLRLFVSSGGLEKDIDEAARRFAQQMGGAEAPASFSWHRYPDDTHSLTPLSSAGEGLRFVFEPIAGRGLLARLDATGIGDAASLEQALAAAEKAYGEGARSLLLPESLPERLVNRLGYQLLESGKAALANIVFRRNTELYPESFNACDSLADGLIAAGDSAGALAQLRKALELSKKKGVPLAEETRKKLEKLERAGKSVE
jgi:predicted alpha/beta superfamily hydrolase